MAFEFDETKSAANLEKHNIDFQEAQGLWKDLKRFVMAARIGDESRGLLIGKLRGKHWTAVYTMRGPNTRVISVRRARPNEVELYEQNDR